MNRKTDFCLGFLLGIIVLHWTACSSKDDSEIVDVDSDMNSGSAEFSVEASIGDIISTVGIVKWSVNVDSIDDARIDFGPDTEYGMIAPVNLKNEKNQTLLLGMKPSSTYHFRISAIKGDTLYRSSDYTVETGPGMNGLAPVSIETTGADAGASGFIISVFGADSTAFILDNDGEYVWWTQTSIIEATRAEMSYDGMHMFVCSGNIDDEGEGRLVKFGIDGSYEQTFELADLHHDFAVLPDNKIAYIEYDKTGVGICDRIVEIKEDGSQKEVYSLRMDFGEKAEDREWCKANAIHYVESEDSYYLSVLKFGGFVKIDRESGTLEWVFGGDESDFDLGGEAWRTQHGFHVLDGALLFFNNNGNAWTSHSRALEFKLDEEKSTAELLWEYYDEEDGPISNYQGDVQRLPNGNTFIDYSAAGEWREVNADGNLQRKWSWPMGGATGYTTWRESLYGPPPK